MVGTDLVTIAQFNRTGSVAFLRFYLDDRIWSTNQTHCRNNSDPPLPLLAQGGKNPPHTLPALRSVPPPGGCGWVGPSPSPCASARTPFVTPDSLKHPLWCLRDLENEEKMGK